MDKVQVYIDKRQRKISAARSWVETAWAEEKVRPPLLGK